MATAIVRGLVSGRVTSIRIGVVEFVKDRIIDMSQEGLEHVARDLGAVMDAEHQERRKVFDFGRALKTRPRHGEPIFSSVFTDFRSTSLIALDLFVGALIEPKTERGQVMRDAVKVIEPLENFAIPDQTWSNLAPPRLSTEAMVENLNKARDQILNKMAMPAQLVDEGGLNRARATLDDINYSLRYGSSYSNRQSTRDEYSGARYDKPVDAVELHQQEIQRLRDIIERQDGERHRLEREIAELKRGDSSIEGELSQGMVSHSHNWQAKRTIHVDRDAIDANKHFNETYPTIRVVEEGGQTYHFHAVKFRSGMIRGNITGGGPVTAIITHAPIVGYLNKYGPQDTKGIPPRYSCGGGKLW